jgi:hypothetical protein
MTKRSSVSSILASFPCGLATGVLLTSSPLGRREGGLFGQTLSLRSRSVTRFPTKARKAARG